jgi:hypothetical protein
MRSAVTDASGKKRNHEREPDAAREAVVRRRSGQLAARYEVDELTEGFAARSRRTTNDDSKLRSMR